MTVFGLQQQAITPTPTGRIDSRHLDGADGSDVVPSWAATGYPPLTLTVGTAFSADLAALSLFTDPGSPASELGFHRVSGQSPITAGFSFSGTTLQNPATLPSNGGSFQLVAVRNGISVLSPVLSYSIQSPVNQPDMIAPSVPTGITVMPATGSVVVGFDSPCDVGAANSPASGCVHVEILANGSLASPPGLINVQANALTAPTMVNIGAISSPDLPIANQSASNGKQFTVSAAGTGIAATASEQCGYLDFGTFTAGRRLVAKVDPYTSTAGTALIGIMVHETAAVGGKFIAVCVRPSNGTTGIYVISRATSSSASTQVASVLLDANGQPILGGYLKIELAADNKTLTVYWSPTENGWTLITTQTIAFASSVHCGAVVTSQSAGTDVTGVIEEFAITSLARTTATVSIQSAVQLQLASVDAIGNVSALSTPITGVPSSTQSNAIKFNTGHYMASNALINANVMTPGATLTAITQEISAMKASLALGWRGNFCLSALEPTTLGVYTGLQPGGWVDSLYTMITGISQPGDTPTGKRMSLDMEHFTVYGSVNTGIIPTYMLNNPTIYGAGSISGTGGYYSFNGGRGCVTAFWRQAVMDRVIAAIQALATHVLPSGNTVDQDPYFENLFSWEITAPTAADSGSGYSDAGYQTQYNRFFQAAVAAFPHTVTYAMNNYVGGNVSQCCNLTTFLYNNRCGISSPDLFGLTCILNQAIPPNNTGMGVSGSMTTGYRAYLGTTLGNSGPQPSGYSPIPNGLPDLRSKMPCAVTIEQPEMGPYADGTQAFHGFGAPFTPQDFCDNALQTLHANYIFWTWLAGNAPAQQDPNSKRNIGTSAGNWRSVTDAISANAILYTTRPDNIG